jgi:hypothetical protein
MGAITIEILNPKALQLIKEMQDLNLIKVSDEPVSTVDAYLKKMRKKAGSAPSAEDIAKIVNGVRRKRHTKK